MFVKSGKSFSKLPFLKHHLSPTHKYKLKCTFCGKQFTGKDYYQRQVSKCNLSEKTAELSTIQNYFDDDDDGEDFVLSMIDIFPNASSFKAASYMCICHMCFCLICASAICVFM